MPGSEQVPGSAARCPFCEAQPGQAVTATEAQADAHRNHMPMMRCESCKTDVPINDWDYGVCGRCRRLAGAE